MASPASPVDFRRAQGRSTEGYRYHGICLNNQNIKNITKKDVLKLKLIYENPMLLSFLTLQDNNLSNFIDCAIRNSLGYNHLFIFLSGHERRTSG